MSLLRSFLFTPANHARHVEKALASSADAVILDLEDAVAVDQKVSARGDLIAALAKSRSTLCYARVNDMSTEWCLGDLLAVVQPGLDGIVLPKVSEARQIATADWLLTQLEKERGLIAGALDLIPLIETASGLAKIYGIARASRRVKRVAFGAGDFTLDVGATWTVNEQELLWARSTIVVASRAADLEAPIDTVWLDLKDPQGLMDSVNRAKGLGFQGKLCIHPVQLDTVHQGLTPTDAEIESARRIVAAFRAAEAEGIAAIRVDGQMVDYPIAFRAERLLEKHGR